MQTIVTIRALIVHQGKLLICKHKANTSFYCLPGGKLEPGETLEAGLKRELIEETGITPRISRLIFINQFINATNHRVEFFFLVSNGNDYARFDPAKASHAYEIANFTFGDPTDPQYNLKPDFLRERFAEVLTRHNQFELEIITSN